MIDKINNINASNAQNKRNIDENKQKISSSEKPVADKEVVKDVDKIEINSSIETEKMAATAPLDLDKVSAIKNAISKGEYPIDIEKVADALLEAYKDIK